MYNTNRKTEKPLRKEVKKMQLTLKAIRVNKGWTQEEASKKIGINIDTLRNYENGKSYPDIPVLKKIEETYETPYDKINFFPEK